jgi:Smr domain
VSIVESLKRLFDPAAARQEDAERRANREQPERDDAGPGKWYECRVCRHVGPEPTFCPTCLAGTMRPTRAPAQAPEVEAKPPAAEAEGEQAVELPFDGTLDLHTFSPKDVRLLLPEYLAGCVERGQRQLRIVHGKGTGAMRRTVQTLLGRDPRVESFRTAGEDAGGWGATLVTLRVRKEEE